MKYPLIIACLFAGAASADDAGLAEKIIRHQDGSSELAEQQDELSADVQQLIIEQTHPKVIEMLRLVEDAMDEASERLLDHDTGGETIAAETEVIEKIYEAAKAKQQQSGQGSQSGSAMLDMMQRMLGMQPADKPGDKPGQDGSGGDSDLENKNFTGEAEGKTEARRIPKNAGTAGKTIPREFREALDAYNRGIEQLSQSQP